MKFTAAPVKSITLLAVTFGITISFVLLNHESPHPTEPGPMARSFVLWLHGLGDSGPANEPIKTFFTSAVFANTKWSFPSAPHSPVTCNYGAVMPSWFDIHEIPVTADSPNDEGGVLKAVDNVHAMIDKEIAAGTSPNNVFICGFSQGGALTLASILLYPKTLGGGAVFSGWVPINSSIIERVTPEAKKNKYEELKSSKLAEGVVEKDIDDSALFYEASGVKNNRGRSYGCGSEAVFFESSSSRYTRFKTTHSTDPAVQDLQSRLTDVESQLAELRGLFEKMDGAFFRHGGSSSGVPRPCDDENEINPIGDDIEEDDD